MKYGARNKITAKVTSIQSDQIMSLVKFDVLTPAQMASVLTTESVKELGLKVGDTVLLVIRRFTFCRLKNRRQPPLTSHSLQRTSPSKGWSLNLGRFWQLPSLASVVGTSRCDVRAACSGATSSNAIVARIFVPPVFRPTHENSSPSLRESMCLACCQPPAGRAWS
jgi:molybdopterin-binding protein